MLTNSPLDSSGQSRPPRFNSLIRFGQRYFPSWERYEAAFRGIFKRQYYTNNGPLLTELEERLQHFLGVKHAICVSNATFGLMMAAEALSLNGKVVMPSFAFIGAAQSLKWSGIEPVFCDVDPETYHISVNTLDMVKDEGVSGVLAVNLWGGACGISALESYANDNGLKLYFDSSHSFGCAVGDTSIGNYGDLEVLSFHEENVLSAADGGCICTNDDNLADRLRSIRPSYGGDATVRITKVANARMSEAQAALALMNLDDFFQHQKNNEMLFQAYEDRLNKIPGIKIIRPAGVTFSNYQYAACEVDEQRFGISRDLLAQCLKNENVEVRREFYPGVHRTPGFFNEIFNAGNRLPVTERLCLSCIQLPLGALVNSDDINSICEIINDCHRNADVLNS